MVSGLGWVLPSQSNRHRSTIRDLIYIYIYIYIYIFNITQLLLSGGSIQGLGNDVGGSLNWGPLRVLFIMAPYYIGDLH